MERQFGYENMKEAWCIFLGEKISGTTTGEVREIHETTGRSTQRKSRFIRKTIPTTKASVIKSKRSSNMGIRGETAAREASVSKETIKGSFLLKETSDVK